MNRKYKCPADVPNDVLAKRLKELSLAVAGGKETLLREFVMRIPVELDRDADIVLSLASGRMKSLTQHNAVLTEALELYANPENWGLDDWGVKAVNCKEYSDAGEVARKVLAKEGA